ncbi:protein kinase [Trypanosoma rangeli]|uniref:Protein kinase n=1 Tax=Trypanosoma rangeli TaxID=5698 RepID=A0A3R7JV29_TRYRA|nr:protein kinase [Trypanosoma rangeli]RNE95933.1 protein kinase [Trypanosoma rangeli]|eukprot:RNE95933.1 protein kinase [Trypanosoma rangeli]
MSATPYRGSATLASWAGRCETKCPCTGSLSAAEANIKGKPGNEVTVVDADEGHQCSTGGALITSWTDSQELRSPPTVRCCGQLLGRGRQGAVWLCEDTQSFGAYYAVKVIETPSLTAVSVHQAIQKLRHPSSSQVDFTPTTSLKNILLDASFEEEVRLLQRLRHPGLVQLHGVETELEPGGIAVCRIYLEYMSGGSLLSFVRQHYEAGRLREQALRWFLNPIVEALSYMHANGVVHLDVKAENILVTWGDAHADDCGAHINTPPLRFPVTKLGDFGCARLLRTGSPSKPAGSNGSKANKNKRGWTQSSGKMFSGTPGFMAPEVILQSHTMLDSCGTAADVWSLGCTILQLLRGAPPTQTDSNPVAALFETAMHPKKIWRFIPPIGRESEICGATTSSSSKNFREDVVVSATLRDLLLHCLQPDPRKRATAAQLLQHPFFKHPCSPADAAEGIVDPNVFYGHEVRGGLKSECLSSGMMGSATSMPFDGLSNSDMSNEDADADAMLDN